jgi:hypothetical protein
MLVTLSRVLDLLGAARFTSGGLAAVKEMREVGFPTDWLQYFSLSAEGAHSASAPGDEQAAGIIAGVARLLNDGIPVADVRQRLATASFRFVPSAPGFAAAEETGEHEPALLRLQVSGGYRDGIIRGGMMDVAGQLVAALPQANFLLTVPDELLVHVRALAMGGWRLRRREAVVLVPERLSITCWAQDNAKAGVVRGGPGSFWPPATLAPRYASQDELNSPFFPGDSFLMNGLQQHVGDSRSSPLRADPFAFGNGNLPQPSPWLDGGASAGGIPDRVRGESLCGTARGVLSSGL